MSNDCCRSGLRIGAVLLATLVLPVALQAEPPAVSADALTGAAEQEAVSGVSRAQAISKMLAGTRDESGGGQVAGEEAAAGAYSPWRVLQGLGLVAGLFLVGAYLYRRVFVKTVGDRPRRIVILERVQIHPKSFLVLAEVDGERVLVGTGAERMEVVRLDGRLRRFKAELHQSMEAKCPAAAPRSA